MASPYSQRRSSSRAFLPPDPRVAEPYRFTPQLAVRVGVLAALALVIFAVLFLRLWALQVLSGDRYLNAAQNNQLRTVPARGAARLDPRPRRQHDRLQRARHGGADLDRRPARGGPLRDAAAALEGAARAAAAADESARGGQGRPADADPRQDGRARGPGGDPARAAARVPGRLGREHLPAQLREPGARGAGARVRRRDLAGGARSDSRTTATAAARRSARPASRRRSTRTSAARREPRSSGSTRSAFRRARAGRPSAGRRSRATTCG